MVCSSRETQMAMSTSSLPLVTVAPMTVSYLLEEIVKKHPVPVFKDARKRDSSEMPLAEE